MRALLLAPVLLIACDPPGAKAPPCSELFTGAPPAPEDAPAEALPPAPLRLNLPLPPGEAVLISQGPDGHLTHTGEARFAWDFDLPVGSAVLAAADGLVVRAVGGHHDHGPDPRYRDLANLVTLDHGQGYFSTYVHLAPDGVLVTIGERVRAGELIGWTGLSGQLLGPHLHFHVEDSWGRTVPIRFYSDETGRCDAFPRTADAVSPPPPAPFPGEGPSEAAPALFEDLGVTDLRGLPARLFERARTYAVTGRAPGEATEVVFLLLPPTGGAAVATTRWAVDPSGAFSGALSLSEVPPGDYAWALTATTGGPVTVPSSVRCGLADGPPR